MTEGIEADTGDIGAALERAEQALQQGDEVRSTGFWPAVTTVRRNPALAAEHADRIAAIDRQVFEQKVPVRTSLRRGNVLLASGTLAGTAAVALGYRLDGLAQALAVLGGYVVLHFSTHALAHWAIGRLLGIDFTHYFVASRHDPFPGVKTDYASYLRKSPRARAIMHASGAVVSKILPFAVLGVALSMDAPRAVLWVLAAVGAGGIVVDVLVSTKHGDWMKVRRELSSAAA